MIATIQLALFVTETFVSPLSGSAAWCCFSGPAYTGYHGADDAWGPQKLPEIIEARHRSES